MSSLSTIIWNFSADSNIRYVEFHLVGTSRQKSFFYVIPANPTHSFKLSKSLGKDLTDLTMVLIFEIDCWLVFKPSFTTKFRMWVQHLTCKWSPSNNNQFILLSLLFSTTTTTSFDDALSTTIFVTFLRPHFFKISSTCLPMASPLWLGATLKY